MDLRTRLFPDLAQELPTSKQQRELTSSDRVRLAKAKLKRIRRQLRHVTDEGRRMALTMEAYEQAGLVDAYGALGLLERRQECD